MVGHCRVGFGMYSRKDHRFSSWKTKLLLIIIFIKGTILLQDNEAPHCAVAELESQHYGEKRRTIQYLRSLADPSPFDFFLIS